MKRRGRWRAIDKRRQIIPSLKQLEEQPTTLEQYTGKPGDLSPGVGVNTWVPNRQQSKRQPHLGTHRRNKKMVKEPVQTQPTVISGWSLPFIVFIRVPCHFQPSRATEGRLFRTSCLRNRTARGAPIKFLPRPGIHNRQHNS